MLLPIGDEPNPSRIPWVTWGLIIVNVVVFGTISIPLMAQPADPSDPATVEYLRRLLEGDPSLYFAVDQILEQLSAYDVFLYEWGFRPAEPTLVTLVTSEFLHGGWFHLLGNMLFLWIFGDNVEERLGSVAFLIAYLAAGIAATVSYDAVFGGEPGVPLVGASGAISGVLGFYFVWFKRNRVRVFVFLFPILIQVIRIPARWVLGFYLIVDNILPFVLSGGAQGGIAHGAHIGGFAAGALGALGVDWFVGRRGGAAVAAAAAHPGHPVAAQLAQGRPASALRTYAVLPPSDRRLVPVDTVLGLAEWLANDGQPDRALALLGQALKDHPEGPFAARLLLAIGLVLLDGKGRPVAAAQYLLNVFDVDPEPEVAAAARRALDRIRAGELPT